MADVVIAEDDPILAEVVQRYVANEGHRVRVVDNSRSALEVIRQIGILMVTARKTENDVLLGLDLGADDYLVKPVSPREPTGRLRALLRRIEA